MTGDLITKATLNNMDINHKHLSFSMIKLINVSWSVGISFVFYLKILCLDLLILQLQQNFNTYMGCAVN